MLLGGRQRSPEVGGRATETALAADISNFLCLFDPTRRNALFEELDRKCILED
jgi:hypothetical protein